MWIVLLCQVRKSTREVHSVHEVCGVEKLDVHRRNSAAVMSTLRSWRAISCHKPLHKGLKKYFLNVCLTFIKYLFYLFI